MVQLQIWCVVENNTVCIAASIPTLRPLLRKSGAGSSLSYNYGTDDKKRKSSACNRLSQSRYADFSTTGQHHDGNSEEYILASVEADGSDQITKTTDVSVAFESRNAQGDNTKYEQGTGNMLPAFLQDGRGT